MKFVLAIARFYCANLAQTATSLVAVFVTLKPMTYYKIGTGYFIQQTKGNGTGRHLVLSEIDEGFYLTGLDSILIFAAKGHGSVVMLLN